MIASSLQFGVARLSGRKDGHPNRSATPINFRKTIIGDSNMKRIEISTPKHPDTFLIVDDDDFERVNKLKWTPTKFQRSKTLYAHSETNGYKVFVHRFILNLKKGEETDHVDGNGLNNQKSNLRKCSHAQNMQNRGMPKNNRSGFKGVHWCCRENRWRAMIGVGGKQKTLIQTFCIIKAAKVYDKAAIKYHGEFAYLNF